MKWPKFNLSDISMLNPLNAPANIAGYIAGQGVKSIYNQLNPNQDTPPPPKKNNVDLLTGLNQIADKFKPKGPDIYDKAQKNIQPYAQQGLKDYETLGNMVKSGQFKTKIGEFDYNVSPPSDFKFEQMPEAYKYQQFVYNPNEDPGTQFRMQQGTNAINTSAAMRGGALSGAAMKELARYGQDLGSQEYQNAYNRFQQGQGMQAQLGQQNIMNAQQQQGMKYQDYANKLNQWDKNKNFAYNQFTDKYNMGNQQALQAYNQMSGLANVGIAAGQNMANIDLAKAGALNAQQLQQSSQANQIKLQQMQNENAQQLQGNQINAQNKWNEQSSFNDMMNSFLQAGGTALGGILAGPGGAMAGSQLGNMNNTNNIPYQPFNYNQYNPRQYRG